MKSGAKTYWQLCYWCHWSRSGDVHLGESGREVELSLLFISCVDISGKLWDLGLVSQPSLPHWPCLVTHLVAPSSSSCSCVVVSSSNFTGSKLSSCISRCSPSLEMTRSSASPVWWTLTGASAVAVSMKKGSRESRRGLFTGEDGFAFSVQNKYQSFRL